MSTVRYRRHPDLRIATLEGEGVVLHLGERRYFSINDTGLTLLESTREPRTFEELVSLLVEEYEVDREEANRTAREFLDRCVESKVLLEELS